MRFFEASFLAVLWVGRLYGTFFLALGVLFLYWGARGLAAYANGLRVAWSDPVACGAGLVAGVLSLWAGVHLLRSGIPRLRRARGISEELETTLEEAMRLEQSDPAASRQLLDSYFMREAAATEARRTDLRHRAVHDLSAALELRRELQNELTSNAHARKDMLANLPDDERAAMLTAMDTAESQLHSELLQLDGAIQRLRL